ncbi:MAG: formate dehydrogenase subunit alpha [Aeromonas sp.]
MKLTPLAPCGADENVAQPANSRDGVSRRRFLQGSGAALTASWFAPAMMQRADASESAAAVPADAAIEIKRTICTHCSVGCGLYAEVQNGVWTGQEPAFDHPFNLGGHCAKGAALREHGHGERRLKYPMKLVDGQWQRVSWQQAIDEVSAKVLDLRQQFGPDSVYWLGSAKFSNEQAYLFRKFAALWGTNNVDHQARICHSTTVAGVANVWGYGAMTNSLNDMHNSKSIMFIGSNPAEAHPVAMRHILLAKERNACKILVVDPRRTRTAAKADMYLPLRPGTDVAFIWGLLWHIFANNWQDEQFIAERVYGIAAIRAEVANWAPAEVERVCGLNEAQVYAAAKLLADNRPGCVVWCMGGTQHTTGNNNTRAYCILELALGNMGKAGGGTNIFRGHDNVQGATDFGVTCDSLPGYYGISEAAWAHWAAVWDVELTWLKTRFDPKAYNDKLPMFSPGIPVSRWVDGVLENPEHIEQNSALKAMFYWGHAVNSQTRGLAMKKAMSQLELMVIVDPYPSVASVMHERQNGVYLLPAATQFETYGSVTATNRSMQWRDQVIEPLFEAKPDHEIMYLFSQKFGFASELCKHIKVQNNQPLIEDIVREYNRGMWSIGITGQSPERLKSHQQNWHAFHKTELKGQGGSHHGEIYGLPWPCWGTPEFKHGGTHILYDTSISPSEGGGGFRASFGTEHDGQTLLAEGSWPKGSAIRGGYPEISAEFIQAQGWWDELTPLEQQAAAGKNWKTDRSGGLQRVAINHGLTPYGNAKARCVAWNFPDPVPLHREPLYTPRRDLLPKYQTWADKPSLWRLPTQYASIQARDVSQEFPIVLTSGRLVEYEGGGEETRSNPWLAELQQEMFVEINPVDANNVGVQNGDDLWVEGPEGGRVKVKALVTPRVSPGLAFMPFHFAGRFQGEDLRSRYPAGSDPYVLGESVNIITTYGYDPVTLMQETKVTLCRFKKVEG